MCDSFVKYMLVQDKETKKRKVVFQYPFDISDRENMKIYQDLNRNILNVAYIQLKHPYLSRYFQENRDKEFVEFLSVPCGKCPDCLNSRARDWTYRIMSEAKKYKNNWFVTLTYDDEHQPLMGSLVKKEISAFNKKLRAQLERDGKESHFRFYGVGEYGSHTFRPHYHVIYFNLPLDDLVYIGKTKSGLPNYESKFLQKVWGLGFVNVGFVDEASAAYVARYTEKKQMASEEEKQAYEECGLLPEFALMSRKPGIGSDELESISEGVKNEVYSRFVRGHAYSIPMYYRKKIDIESFKSYNKIKELTYLNNNLCMSDMFDIKKYQQYLYNKRSHLKKERSG